MRARVCVIAFAKDRLEFTHLSVHMHNGAHARVRPDRFHRYSSTYHHGTYSSTTFRACAAEGVAGGEDQGGGGGGGGGQLVGGSDEDMSGSPPIL